MTTDKVDAREAWIVGADKISGDIALLTVAMSRNVNGAQAERIKALEAHIQEAADRMAKFGYAVTRDWHLAALKVPT